MAAASPALSRSMSPDAARSDNPTGALSPVDVLGHRPAVSELDVAVSQRHHRNGEDHGGENRHPRESGPRRESVGSSVDRGELSAGLGRPELLDRVLQVGWEGGGDAGKHVEQRHEDPDAGGCAAHNRSDGQGQQAEYGRVETAADDGPKDIVVRPG